MANGIDIVINERQRQHLVEALEGIRGGVNIAISAAINRTLRAGRTILRRRIQRSVRIKAAYFNDRVVSIRQATRTTRQGALVISREQIPLIQYGASQLKRGVSVRVYNEGKREKHPHWFIAKMASGHVGVFKRFGPKVAMSSGAYVPGGPRNLHGRVLRQKITEIKGPSILGIYQKTPSLAAEVLGKLGDELQKNLDSQVDRLLQRKKSL